MRDVVERMKKVEQAVLALDETVRAPAFAIMREYILFGRIVGNQTAERDARVDAGGERLEDAAPAADFTEFMDRHEGDNPADNAKAIAAYHYSRYGIEPFSLDEVRKLAAEAGVTIPARVDATFQRAAQDKKPLFKPVGSGRFRPTVHAEAYFRATYGVTKGTKKRPTQL